MKINAVFQILTEEAFLVVRYRFVQDLSKSRKKPVSEETGFA
jgi:hypothetical protein